MDSQNGRRGIRWAALSLIIVALAIFAHPGCGGGRNEQRAEQAVVDPRFASAEALVNHFNSLTTKPPIDVPELFALYYAENDLQRRMLELVRIGIPLYELGAAMRERFNAPLDPATPKAFLALPNEPARLIERGDQRAVAQYQDWDRTTEKLQLVKIGDRWWISGYTIQHDPSFKPVKSEELMVVEMGLKAMAAVAPSMAARMRAGEWHTPEEARSALFAASQQYAREHPQEFKQYEAVVRQNPDLFGGRKP